MIKNISCNPPHAQLSALGTHISATICTEMASKLLDTEFGYFRSLVDPAVSLLKITKPYSLPADVAKHISLVDDIMRLPSLRKPQITEAFAASGSADSEFSNCGSKYTGDTNPSVLRDAYTYSNPTSAASGNSVAVAEFQYQYYDEKDLSSFSSACGETVKVTSTIGGNKQRLCEVDGCVEALLDIEYIGALTSPIPLTVVYQQEFSILDWVDSIMALSNPPLVHSVSYGNDEIQQTSTEYMYSVNTQFMAAGAMGLSILFAAGDQGVCGRSGCSSRGTYNPDFPASSPYVTSVGGTNFQTEGVIGAESAWSCGGGGFSNTFARPSWQDDAVASYLAKAASVLPESSLYNSSGRAYPDVAALGGQTNPYFVAVHGGSKFAGVAGTSASCPVVSAVFAALNNVRLAAGKPSLGWLNPSIYSSFASCFNDINDGSNNGCEKGVAGFATVAGFDPATGFGSPNYECLAKIALTI